jgi:hypothetical protein
MSSWDDLPTVSKGSCSSYRAAGSPRPTGTGTMDSGLTFPPRSDRGAPRQGPVAVVRGHDRGRLARARSSRLSAVCSTASPSTTIDRSRAATGRDSERTASGNTVHVERWHLCIVAWVIQDGNHPDLTKGQRAEFSPERARIAGIRAAASAPRLIPSVSAGSRARSLRTSA